MMRIGTFLTPALIIALHLVLLLASCSRPGESNAHLDRGPKESAMKLESQTTSKTNAIPPIDATAPEAFQTATFGLG